MSITPVSAASIGITTEAKNAPRSATRLRPVLDAALLFAGFLTICLFVLLWRLPIVTNILYVPQNIYNFGSVARGTDVRQTFTLRNLHPWPVTVLHVQGGCGCTKAFVGKEEPFQLKPLESVAVNATLDTSAKQGKTEQTISVITSDNAAGTPLVLRGFVTK